MRLLAGFAAEADVELPGGTVTFLFTDIEDSAGLWESRTEAMAGSLTRHDSILRESIESAGGVVFKTVGDAFCAAFPSPLQAVNAAVSAQCDLRDEAWTDTGLPVKVRMGLHVGAPERREGDYIGPAVNRVARVCELGHGGQILLTGAVYEMLREGPPIGVSFRSLSGWRLKGMARPETIYQIVADGLTNQFPPLRSVGESAGNLPEVLASFVGRDPEIRQLTQRLDTQKLVTLRGPGGGGKTRLAIETARSVAVDYPGGAWLVRLDPIQDPDLIAREVARTLRVYVPAEQTTEDTLAARLADRPTLLILDNCEHLRQACAQFVHGLLARCPDLRLLATSRETLGVPGEQVFEVHPLRLPKRSRRLTLAALRGTEAVQLFVERAEAGSAFTLTRENAGAVAEICRALDGIPLALELAARWAGVLPIEEIARELSALINEPPDELGIVPARQQTMRATVDWSYTRLAPEAQRLFLSLSVFSGGFTLEAARAMTTGAGESPTQILRLLKGLVDRSFVFFDEAALPDPRYRLLEPVREVAFEKLHASGGESSARDQHRDYYLNYALRAEPELQGTQQALWLERIEADSENFRAALKWSVDAKTRLSLALALHRFWLVRGPASEARAWLEGALAQAGSLEDALRARTLNVLGIFAWTQSDIETAQRYFAESFGIYERLESRPETAMLINNMAMVAKFEADYARAIEFYQRGLAIYRELNDDRHVCAVLTNLGGALSDSGDYSAAIPVLEESLRLHRACGDRLGAAAALYNLGDAAMFSGQSQDARAGYTESLQIYADLNDVKGTVRPLVGLGSLHISESNFAIGLAMLSAADSAAEQTSVPMSPRTRLRFDAAVTTARQILTPGEFDQCWYDGRHLALVEVVPGLPAQVERAGADPRGAP